MSEPFIGQIMPIPYTFAPRDWAFCDGTIMNIQQNAQLFSILGPTFGGDGHTTFALPDLRGRIPIGTGQGPQLTERLVGSIGGEESVTLSINQIMAHTHTAVANDSANQLNPTGMIWGGDATGTNPYYSDVTPTAADILQLAAIEYTGGLNAEPQPHDNMPPVMGMNYIIALEGIFPARS